MAIPASLIPAFDELHVVSDLHLGGPAGFQIFDLGAPFGRLADHLRTRASSGRRIALLINGDLVDFLAERFGKSPAWDRGIAVGTAPKTR